MADLEVWRAAYCKSEDSTQVFFTDWVLDEGRADALVKLMAVNPPDAGSPGGIEPVFLGWEKKELEILD